jgi:hypothetical protein
MVKQMNKYLRMIVLCFFVALVLVMFTVAVNDLQCIFYQNTTCPAGTARLIGLENDTHNGYNNAHAQNKTISTYNYSICCNNTNSSIIINTSCPGNVTVIRLSNATNAHVEIGTNSNYINGTACFGSSWKKVSCEYPQGSCSAGYACILSMAGTEGINTTNAHVANCSLYNQKVCCGLTNYAPVRPTLYYPANNNISVFERNPNFNWSAAADPDGGFASYYTLNLTCGSCSAGCYQPNIGSLTTTNYTIPNALCVDTSYNWSVTACDAYGDCNTSVVFNFTILSVADLVLIVNATSFGAMALGQNNDTTDNGPPPLVARNNGNVLLNVTVNATKLFAIADMNTYNFQFKADQNESGSYVTSCSQDALFANMSNTTAKTLFCNLSYVDVNDEGQLEINLTVPMSEPPGTKNSSIEVSYVKSE